MHTPTTPDPVEIIVEDPDDGQRHTFTGATEAEAEAKADQFFGVDQAEEGAL
jgi:hypothetical protein